MYFGFYLKKEPGKRKWAPRQASYCRSEVDAINDLQEKTPSGSVLARVDKYDPNTRTSRTIKTFTVKTGDEIWVQDRMF